VTSAASKNRLLNSLVEDFFAAAEDLRLDLCDAIYAALEMEHDARCEDEALVELAEANEYSFTTDGSFWR
jgi:hypothetical protein